MQYTEIFIAIRKEKYYVFLIFAQNIDCGYTFELLRGGSNEYPQSMFWGKNKKIGIPLQTPVLQYKSWVREGMHFMDMFSLCSNGIQVLSMLYVSANVFNQRPSWM